MANNSGGGGSGWASPERTVVWTEPKPHHKQQKKQQQVAVVYYLCRQDVQLDHPHFVHVPCLSVSDSGPPRLYLRDVIARLSDLRGAAMPAAYSWSAKRTYRNAGYVWHDLTADDLILPAHPNDEYVLKGSPMQLLLHPNTVDTTVPQLPPPEGRACRKNRWTSFDLADYKRSTGAPAAELIGIDEISPPPSSSSPDDSLNLQQQEEEASYTAAGTPQPQAPGGLIGGGRMRASAMLMNLISCGAGGGGSIKEDVQQRIPPPPRRIRSDVLQTHIGRGHCNKGDEVDVERDYFSGSLVETTNKTGGDGELSLRRSSSCNADRAASSRLTASRTPNPRPPGGTRITEEGSAN